MRNALLRSFALRVKGLSICLFVTFLFAATAVSSNANHHRHYPGHRAGCKRRGRSRRQRRS